MCAFGHVKIIHSHECVCVCGLGTGTRAGFVEFVIFCMWELLVYSAVSTDACGCRVEGTEAERNIQGQV